MTLHACRPAASCTVDDPMRVILSPHSLRRGGAERVVLELARGLAGRGHETLVVPWVDVDEHPEARYREVSRRFLSTRQEYRWPRSAISAARAFRGIVEDFRPDVIAIHDPGMCWPVALAGPAVPVLHILHGYGWISPPTSAKKSLLHFLDRQLFRRLRPHVAVVSEAMADSAAGHYRIAAEAVRTLPNGIDIARFAAERAKPCTKPSILMVGTLNANKGQHLAVEAFAQLIKALPGATLTIVGDGPDRAALESRVAASGQGAHIRLLGRREDIPALMADASLLWQLSRSEAHPLTILEAMASGLPVIGFDVEGVRDAIRPGETGFLLRYGDLEGLVGRTCQIAGDRTLQERLGREARQLAESCFSIETMVDRHERLLAAISASDSAGHTRSGEWRAYA